MSDKCDVDSDSDVSSNSSWTVLEEKSDLQTATNSNTKDASQEENEIDDDTFSLSTGDLFADASSLENDTQPPEINDDDDLQYTLSFSEIQNEEFEEETDDKNELIRHGCLTFEEYLKNQTVNYDKNNKKVCFDEMPKEKQKSDKRKRKKCSGQSFGSLAIIGTVLAVAGVSFLCLLTPGNYSLTSSEIEKLKTECVPAKVLNNCNGSVPLCPVLCTNKDNKLAVVDEDCTIEKCFKKNDVSAPRAKKYLKSTKQFKAVKTINLLDDKNDVKKEDSVGPITFEEFRKESKKYLNKFRKQEKKIKNILKTSSAPVVIKPKSAEQEDGIKSGPVTANVSSQDILKNNENGDKINSKPSTPKMRKLRNQKIKVRAKQFLFNLDDAKNQEKAKIKNKNISEDKFVRKTSPFNQEEKNQDGEHSFDYLTQSKIVCNILQDVMLLKMTSKLARSLNQKHEEVGKVKKKDLRLRKQNRSATDMSLQKHCIKPSIREKQMIIRKLGITSDTKLNLLDELPFSKRKELMKNNKIVQQLENLKMKENEPNHLRSVHFDGYESHMAAIARRKLSNDKKEISKFLETRFPSKKTELSCEKLTNDVENLKKKQIEFFEKLKQHQKERAEYLNLVRERQQQSIKDLIKERQFNVRKDASCGIYNVPIPTASEVHKKLTQLREKKIIGHWEDSSPHNISSTTSLYPSECSIEIDNFPAPWRKKHPLPEKCKRSPADKNEKMSKLLDQRVLSNPSFKKQMVRIPMSKDNDNVMKNQSKVNFKIPNEYLKVKEKYYERVGSYWNKREEYLTKRMEFMKNVSDSIREIVNLQKKLGNGKKEENKEIIESSAGSVMNIINEALTVFPDDTGMKDLKSQMSFSTEKEDNSADEDKNSEIFEFTASNHKVNSSDNNTTSVAKDSLYSSLFGKQGQHIKKRDMAIWYCNKISKRRKFCKDLTKHDMHRLNNKKTKKEH